MCQVNHRFQPTLSYAALDESWDKLMLQKIKVKLSSHDVWARFYCQTNMYDIQKKSVNVYSEGNQQTYIYKE